MAEEGADTGGRDDLLIDASRCLKMRFSGSSCQRCVDVCPHRAISVDGFLAVNPNHCRGCLLCAAVCPSGALEQSADFSACLAQLSRVTEPVLGCGRTKEHSHAALACLGGLSEEHLLALCHTLAGKLTINLSACGACPNSPIVSRLRHRYADLSASDLLEGGCLVVIAESAQDINFRDESVNRRGFFKSLRGSLFQGAALVLSSGSDQSEPVREYAGKRLPLRRELLGRVFGRVAPEISRRVRDAYCHQVVFSGACTACQGCVAVCPTGALLTDSLDDRPRFDPERCTGCGLCVEFCLDGAAELARN